MPPKPKAPPAQKKDDSKTLALYLTNLEEMKRHFSRLDAGHQHGINVVREIGIGDSATALRLAIEGKSWSANNGV